MSLLYSEQAVGILTRAQLSFFPSFPRKTLLVGLKGKEK